MFNLGYNRKHGCEFKPPCRAVVIGFTREPKIRRIQRDEEIFWASTRHPTKTLLFCSSLQPDGQKNFCGSSENQEKNEVCSSLDFLKGRTSAESSDGCCSLKARWQEKLVRIFRKSKEEQRLFFTRFSEGSYKRRVV
jgi:hypothetical protein